MKAGSTYIWLVELDNISLSDVESIIFTLKSDNNIITKTYPNDVSYDGKFNIKLSQNDTLALVGIVMIEAQINYVNKSVVKSTTNRISISDTLATQIITNNEASTDFNEEIALSVTDTIVRVGGGSGTNDYNDLNNKPSINNVTLVGNMTLASIGIDTYVNNYIELHKSELKGDTGPQGLQGPQGEPGQKGDKGDTGASGSDYVITESDYNAIADVVITKLPNAEEVEF